MRIGARRRKAGDHQFLPVRAFGLDPVMAAAGMIGGVGALRDDAFEPHLAGMLEQRGSRLGQRLAQAQRPALWRFRQQPRQRCFALAQRPRFEILAVEMHQVEDVERHAVVTAVLEVLL